MDGRLKLRIVCSVNLALLLTFEEHDEARLARQRAVLQAGEHLLRHEVSLRAEKLHLGKVLVEPHVQRTEVLLHGVAPAEEWQVQIDACSNVHR